MLQRQRVNKNDASIPEDQAENEKGKQLELGDLEELNGFWDVWGVVTGREKICYVCYMFSVSLSE